MSIDYRLIGSRIKIKRKEKNITQEQLAEKLSVTVGYISQIERGITKVNLETLSNISSILDCQIQFLISGVTKESKDYLNDELLIKAQSLNDSQKSILIDIIDIIKRY